MRSVWINMSIKRKKENHLIIRIHDFILQPIYFILTIHSIINPLHPLIYQLYQRKVKKIPKTKFRDHFYNPCCFLKITGITRQFPLPKKTFFILCSFVSPLYADNYWQCLYIPTPPVLMMALVPKEYEVNPRNRHSWRRRKIYCKELLYRRFR